MMCGLVSEGEDTQASPSATALLVLQAKHARPGAASPARERDAAADFGRQCRIELDKMDGKEVDG
jgi:hypothetical protein